MTSLLHATVITVAFDFMVTIGLLGAGASTVEAMPKRRLPRKLYVVLKLIDSSCSADAADCYTDELMNIWLRPSLLSASECMRLNQKHFAS
jgi:hypothetical protein